MGEPCDKVDIVLGSPLSSVVSDLSLASCLAILLNGPRTVILSVAR